MLNQLPFHPKLVLIMLKHYIFFTRNVMPQPGAAHLVHAANSADGMANLGYPSLLIHLSKEPSALNLTSLLRPFRPQSPQDELVNLYNLRGKLKVAALPTPKLKSTSKLLKKATHPSTLISKYYFPVHIRPAAQIVHSRDWNFVESAIKCGVPAIYEHHHHETKQFNPKIVHNPLLQVAVTVADSVRESMIQNGLPADKIIKLHSGFNSVFLNRQPEQAATWRKQLLTNEQYLVVYAGALLPFKGVDLLLDVAQQLTHVHFAFAGGDETQVTAYKQLAIEKQLRNVTFLGHLSHTSLPGLLQASDVLAHPHCSGPASTFTSPLKLFDYLASGTPIVATEITSLTEFKSSNAIAGWCEPDNPDSFAQCIQQVLETYPRKSEGYRHMIDYVQQFSWENRAAKLLSCVKDSMRPVLLQ